MAFTDLNGPGENPNEPFRDCLISADGSHILTSHWKTPQGGWFVLRDGATGVPVAASGSLYDTLDAVDLAPDGLTVALLRSGFKGDEVECRYLFGSRPVRIPARDLKLCRFSPDGRRILGGGMFGNVMLWDIATGEPVVTLGRHQGVVYDGAFSPDGRYIVTASFDKTLRVWDCATGEETARLNGHTHNVVSGRFSPDGARIVSSAADGTVRLWAADSGAQLAVLAEEGSLVGHSRFSPCGRYVAYSAPNGVIVSRSDEAVVACRYPVQGKVNALAWRADGRMLMVGTELGEVLLLEPSGLELGSPVVTPWRAPRDGELGVGCPSCRRWTSLGTAVAEVAVRCAHCEAPLEVKGQELAADWRHVAEGWESWAEHLKAATMGGGWRRLGPRRELPPMPSARKAPRGDGHTGSIVTCLFSPDGKRVISGGEDHILKVWDTATSAVIATMDGHPDEVLACGLAPDGKLLISVCEGEAVMWDADAAQQLRYINPNATEDVLTCTISPDGQRMVTGNDDGCLCVWQVTDWLFSEADLEGHSGSVVACCFSPDGRTLLSCCSEGEVRTWEVSTGEARLSLVHAEEVPVFACGFAPDGLRFATGGADGIVKIWDADSGALILAWGAHTYPLTACAFSPDGAALATAASHGPVRWSNAATGALVGEEGTEEEQQAVAWHPAGKLLAVGGEAGEIRLVEPVGLSAGAPIVSCWESPESGAAYGCPHCASWVRVEGSVAGSDQACTRCGGGVRIATAMIHSDWRPVAAAWRLR